MNGIIIFFKRNANAIAILISITSLCFSFFRCEPMEADWIGILVGILCSLVTVLIGWQIYSIIDFKERAKELIQIKENLNLLSDGVSQAASVSYWALFTMFDKNKEYQGAITSLVSMIQWLLNDVRSNIEVGNFNKAKTELKKSIKGLKNKYESNNCEILKKSINEIITHKNYSFIKNDFDEIFNDILDEVYKDYKDYLHHMNDALKTVGKKYKLGVGWTGDSLFSDISSYWSRHTWATIAYQLDIPHDVIGQALGHAESDTTDIYIRYDNTKVDRANRKVIDYLKQ